MKLGVSNYSFSKYVKQTGCDIYKVCDLAKEMGFDGIEFVTFAKSEEIPDLIVYAKKIKEHCEQLGIEISAYTIGANFLEADIAAEVERVKSHVDIAEALGAPVMRHDVAYALPANHLYTWRNAIDDMAPHIREVTEYAASKGIKTCTENHGYTFQRPDIVEELILKVNNENYGWLFDMGNFLCADADPVLAVGYASRHIFHVHAKDFIIKSGTDCPDGFFTTVGGNHIRGTVIGHGDVPVKNCLNALKRAGYDGYVSVEFEGMEECLPGIRAGLDYLKKNI